MVRGIRWAILAVALVAAVPTGAQTPAEFVAHLWGREQVPSVETKATGVATFRVAPDGTSITYRLELSRAVDVQMAHIHVGAVGQNGPIVVWLYPSAPPPQLKPGRFDGVLAQGTITAANLVGPLAGQPLSALVARMRELGTYVNVHTAARPAGEIRGQILPR